MTVTRYAVDIVILPPEPVIDLAISWNDDLSRQQRQSIKLNKTNCLPHISLLMGCLSSDRIRDAQTALDGIAKESSTLELSIDKVKIAGDEKTPVVTLDVVLTPPLMSLHMNIVTSLGPFLTQDATSMEIDDHSGISPSTIKWINNFKETQCGDNFWPHITVGHGATEQAQHEVNFTAIRVAIFHLGNHCTCRKLLYETSLKK